MTRCHRIRGKFIQPCNSYRRRIKQEFSDGDAVIIELKNRSEPFTVDQEEWYEKAFGPKQNIMDVRITF